SKRRALADLTLDADSALVLFDDLATDAQAQACAPVAVLVRLFGGEERFEDETKPIGRDADAAIGHLDLDHAGASIFTSFESQPAAARHGLAGVDDEIDQDLFELSGNNRGLGPAVELLFHLNAVFAQVLLGENEYFFYQCHNIGHFAYRGAVPREA